MKAISLYNTIKTNKIQRRLSWSGAFTIVELLVVVVVIAILAVITTVAFNGIQKRAMESLLEDALASTASAMEMRAVTEGDYSAIPSTVTLAEGIGIGLAEVENSTIDFCLNATTTRYDNMTFFLQKGQGPQEGLCDGDILATIGDYNDESGGGVAYDYATAPSARTVTAPGDMGFTVATNDDWSQLTLSWNAMPGAQNYRVNHRTTPSGTWYSRDLSTGNNAHNWDYGHNTLPGSSTQLVWTSAAARPTNASQIHEYRIQYRNSSGEWSDFQQLSLSVLEGRPMPHISSFRVMPTSDWSSITLSWDSLGNAVNLPGVRLRVNHRTTPSGTWYSRDLSTGNNAHNWNYSSYSLDPSSTSLTWTSAAARPANTAQTHEYRVQVYSGSEEGEWADFSLNILEYEGISMPIIDNFTVTPSSDWSSITLSWNTIGGAANLPGMGIRVNHRTSSSGTWNSRDLSTGNNAHNWNYASYNLGPSATSLTWTASAARPGVGQTHYYRVHAYSGSMDGPWTEFELSR